MPESFGKYDVCQIRADAFHDESNITSIYVPSCYDIYCIDENAFVDLEPNTSIYFDMEKPYEDFEFNTGAHVYWQGEWEYQNGVPTPIVND